MLSFLCQLSQVNVFFYYCHNCIVGSCSWTSIRSLCMHFVFAMYNFRPTSLLAVSYSFISSCSSTGLLAIRMIPSVNHRWFWVFSSIDFVIQSNLRNIFSRVAAKSVRDIVSRSLGSWELWSIFENVRFRVDIGSSVSIVV